MSQYREKGGRDYPNHKKHQEMFKKIRDGKVGTREWVTIQLIRFLAVCGWEKEPWGPCARLKERRENVRKAFGKGKSLSGRKKLPV